MTGKVFYEVEAAARELGISMEEMEEMVITGELTMTKVGTTRRLVRVSDVETVLERVRSGGRLRTRREFRASSVDGALDRAGAALDIDPTLLSYEVLDRGYAWSPGHPARDARVAVELSEAGEAEDAPVDEEKAVAPVTFVTEGGDAASNAGRRYYSPEQVAILLGVRPQEVNLRIYREELPCSNINGYRWVPAEAVERAPDELSPSGLENPPKPFVILTPAEPGLGTSELIRNGAEPHPLEHRVSQLEERIKDLKHELRLEKARHAQDLEARQDLPSRESSTDPKHAAEITPDGARSNTLTSP